MSFCVRGRDIPWRFVFWWNFWPGKAPAFDSSTLMSVERVTPDICPMIFFLSLSLSSPSTPTLFPSVHPSERTHMPTRPHVLSNAGFVFLICFVLVSFAVACFFFSHCFSDVCGLQKKLEFLTNKSKKQAFQKSWRGLFLF